MKYQVYVHTFPNNKKYVGLSTEKDVNKRGKNGKGYMGQKVVYNAILKYGWDNISHQVFECDTEAEMKYLERYLIRFYNTTDHRYGYNVSEGGEGTPGVGTKSIDQYDKQGNFIRTGGSMKAIEEELNVNYPVISECARRKIPSAYGFYGFYSGETPVFKTKGTCRTVYQFDLEGHFIAEYKNATEAARSLGKSYGNHIIACCNGKRKSAFKFIWRYEC